MIGQSFAQGQDAMTQVRDLLDRQAAGSFVGRGAELALLGRTLSAMGPLVVHLHGIAGIGKSSLLNVFCRHAREAGAAVILLDCRGIEPTEAGLLRELAAATGGAAGGTDEIAARLGHIGAQAAAGKLVVALDTYEVFRLMDTWLRRELLPRLPDNVRFVLCGREGPVMAWMADPGWRNLFQSVRLESLEPREAMDLLAQAGVPEEEARHLEPVCHGHPLALTLAASMRRTEVPQLLRADVSQRVVEELSQLFLAEITDRQTRMALEAASVVRRVTLPVLAALLPDASPHDALERLRALPFVQAERDGLRLHDAVREALAASLRAQNPGEYRAYRKLAYGHYMQALRGAPAAELWRVTADLLYVVENPLVREAFFPAGAMEYAVEPARPQDGPAILAIIERHETERAARDLACWWKLLPGAFTVVRDGEGAIGGFYMVFDPSAVAERYCLEDPIVAEWMRHLKQHPIPRQQKVLFLRRWLAAEEGEAPCPLQAACWIDVKRKYLEVRPHLRRVYLTLCQLEAYAAVATRLGFDVLEGHAVRGGGRVYHSAMLDMGPSSVAGWLARLVAEELGVEEGGLLDLAARELILDGRRVALTRLEFGVMEFLHRSPGEAVSRATLLENVWEQRYPGGGNVVDVVVRSLRQKLGQHAAMLETVRGVGYRLRSE